VKIFRDIALGESRLGVCERSQGETWILKDPSSVLGGDLPLLGDRSARLRGRLVRLLPTLGRGAEFSARHEVTPLCLERAVIDMQIESGTCQMLVTNFRPLLTPGQELSSRVPVPPLEAETIRGEISGGQ
jgi:hypothetical protein